jgi:hypothetical protein
MAIRWDETWHRLREWTNDQGPSERLAAQILLDDGYQSLDPSHPLGGKDGGKDAICIKIGQRWLMAAYFPRGQQDFTIIKAKFVADLAGVARNAAIGIAFVTNQELRLAERDELRVAAAAAQIDLFHLERITAVLDKPSMAGIRKQFLGINISDDTASTLASIAGNVIGGSNIISQNQMGGQVAHSIVNIGPKARRISPAAGVVLISHLESYPKGPMLVASANGDPEAAILAEDIGKVLGSAGWAVNTGQIHFTGPVRNIIFEASEQKDSYDVIINWLEDLQLKPQGRLVPSKIRPEIIVGSNDNER